MRFDFENKKVSDIKIAYIGGGSRGWAWGFMSDLAASKDISGDVYLYDIDKQAADNNEIIGNKYKALPDCKSVWNYHSAKSAKEAYENADFVIISILPATFDEMKSDVHTPEKYNIWQPVGDSTGPGGILRAMRTVPMFEEIGECIKQYCPNAWVINYTNPMTMCVRTLYRVFPDIKAFGCCHEVFGSQKLLRDVVEELMEIKVESFKDIKVNIVGVNHFTWFTKAKYMGIDLFPYLEKYIEKHYGEKELAADVNFDLYKRYGVMAVAGSRHLAEFCEGKWYLENPKKVEEWNYKLTPVSQRKEWQANSFKRSEELLSGKAELKINKSGEEGVLQLRALLGLCGDFVTNVNFPNRGQIPNLPLGAVVETNVVFSGDSVSPVYSGDVPTEILPLVSRISNEHEALNEAIAERDVEKIFNIFATSQLITCSLPEARALFKEMVMNTKEYLKCYDLSTL